MRGTSAISGWSSPVATARLDACPSKSALIKRLMNWSTQQPRSPPSFICGTGYDASRTASAILVLARDYPTIVVAGARASRGCS